MRASPHRAELVDGYRRIKTPLGIQAECKALDQNPREGTEIIFGKRVVRFYNVHLRQFFYEPVTSYDRMVEIVRRNAALVHAGVPLHALPLIHVGFRAFGSARSAPSGVIQMPRPGEVAAGHAVALDGNWREDMLGFVNSWGAGWGDGGYGWLPRHYLEHHLIDAWLERDARVGPTRQKYRRILSSDNRQLAALWMMQNPRWSSDIRHNGFRHRIANFETLSLNDDVVVNVLEVRTGYGRLIAWAHLFFPGDGANGERTGLLKEFFVWPSYRRHGYGRLLERTVAEIAQTFRLERLVAWLYAWDRIRPAAQFGKRLGYSWSWANTPLRPQVQARLVRPL